MGKLNYRRALYIFYTVNMLHLKIQRKQTIFNINTHFMFRATYLELQTSTTVIPQGNLTSDCETKQYLTMKRLFKK
jgi:hypothetical protein